MGHRDRDEPLSLQYSILWVLKINNKGDQIQWDVKFSLSQPINSVTARSVATVARLLARRWSRDWLSAASITDGRITRMSSACPAAQHCLPGNWCARMVSGPTAYRCPQTPRVWPLTCMTLVVIARR